jgi:hypothetical protein
LIPANIAVKVEEQSIYKGYHKSDLYKMLTPGKKGAISNGLIVSQVQRLRNKPIAFASSFSAKFYIFFG